MSTWENIPGPPLHVAIGDAVVVPGESTVVWVVGCSLAGCGWERNGTVDVSFRRHPDQKIALGSAEVWAIRHIHRLGQEHEDTRNAADRAARERRKNG